MRRLALACALLTPLFAFGAETFVCAAALGAGTGASYANCAAAGANFANITPGAGDTIRVCGPDKIRGTLTVTSTANVTVDLGCTGGVAGTISGANEIATWTGPDASGFYTSTSTYAVPFVLLMDGVALREGHGTLAADEWAFNSTNGGTHEVILGTNPTGHVVEVGVRGVGIEFVSSTGAAVTGGRIEGIRHTGTATGNAGVNFRDSTGSVTGTTFYGVRKAVDGTGTANFTADSNTVSVAGDGLDCNKNTSAPTCAFTSNTISDVGYGTYYENTQTSHNITVDGEGIACTNCASFRATGNKVTRANVGISHRADAAATIKIGKNRIVDTSSTGISVGCLSASGVPAAEIYSNVVDAVGRGSGYKTATFAVESDISSCAAAASALTIVGNTIVNSSNGFYFKGANAQTGTVKLLDNIVYEVNPTRVTGSHYFVNWVVTSATHALTITEDYNDYWQSLGTGFFRWVAGSSARAWGASGWASFKTDSSLEAHSIITDPSFANMSDEIYTLRRTSPAVRTGVCYLATGCIYPDHRGYRARVPPNIGAFQQGLGSP